MLRRRSEPFGPCGLGGADASRGWQAAHRSNAGAADIWLAGAPLARRTAKAPRISWRPSSVKALNSCAPPIPGHQQMICRHRRRPCCDGNGRKVGQDAQATANVLRIWCIINPTAKRGCGFGGGRELREIMVLYSSRLCAW